jgi:hypothetical protein
MKKLVGIEVFTVLDVDNLAVDENTLSSKRNKVRLQQSRPQVR